MSVPSGRLGPLKVSIIIPAKNEESSIGPVITGCKNYGDEIIVVDGHSTDKTREIAQSLGVRVVLDHKKGKGEALRTGIAEASGDIIVFIDADGSHSPTDIPRLVAPIAADESDLVVGSRMRGGSDELHGDLGKFIRMVGSDIITLGINYLLRADLTDSQNGFRAIRTSVAKRLNMKENITTVEQEMIIRTLKAGYRVMEVPSHEYARHGGESKINVRKVAWRYVYSWLKYLFLLKQSERKKPRRVLLINPPAPDSKVWVREGRCQQWDIWGAPFPPFSLAMISTQLKKRNFQTHIIDAGPEGLDLQKVLDRAIQFDPQLVVMATTTPTIESDMNWFAEHLKKALGEKVKIAALGIHVSALPEEVLHSFPACDYVVIGEPEITVAELAVANSGSRPLEHVQGIAFRNSEGEVRINPARGFFPDIDKLGFPDWGPLDFRNYKMPILGRPFSMISFSRGCPFSCKYCATHVYNGTKLRMRTVDSLIEEIHWSLKLGIRDFLFWTELMTLHTKYLNDFLDALIRENLHKKIRWVCNSRVDSIDEATAKKMKRAGCWQMAFGFEFGNDDILKLADKGGKATVAQARRAAEIVSKAGIAVDGHFILGYPGETEETMQQTIDLACSIPLTFAHFYAAVPFPGSRLYEEMKEKAWLKQNSWEVFSQDGSCVVTERLNPELVNTFIRKAYRSFYTSPKVMLRILAIPKNPFEFFEIFRLGAQFYFSLGRPQPEASDQLSAVK